VSTIVQLANFYSSTSGGLRIAVDSLAAGYRGRGHSVRLVIPGPRSGSTADRTEIAAPRLPNGTGYRVIVSRGAVRAALTAARPDLIEVHDRLLLPWVARWAYARGVPVVAVSHERLDVILAEFLPRAPDPVLRFLADASARRVVQRADLVVACSRFAADEYGASDKIRLARLGVDLEHFRPRRSEPSAPGLNLVCASRLSPEKRPDLAIAALAELIDRGQAARLTVLGVGPWESRLRTQARGLPVHFGGFVDRDRIARELAAADVALVPGPAETFGLAALEALASGTPVVATAGSGAAELVADRPKAGRAAQAEAVSIADAVMALLAEAEPVRRGCARARAEEFSWGRATASMLAVHAELLG
jgi:alpha-1,6-mannosyltransferase